MYSLGRTTIRAVESDDLAFTRKWRNDPSVSGPALGRPFPIVEPAERSWFDRLGDSAFPTHVVWTVADESAGPVGLVQLTDIHWIHRTSKFGIWIAPEHQAQGHASRATQLACTHGLEVLGLRQIRLEVLDSHDAARTVYRKNGFSDEAILHDAVLINGRPRSLHVMILCAPAAAPSDAPTPLGD